MSREDFLTLFKSCVESKDIEIGVKQDMYFERDVLEIRVCGELVDEITLPKNREPAYTL